MSRAHILVLYRLSEQGRTAALSAGINAGEVQTIVLRAPGYEVPEAPADAVKAMVDAASATLDAAKDAPVTPDLAVAVAALVAVTGALVQVLDPSTTRNVTVEQASPELWDLAVSLATINDKGESTISVRPSRYSSYTAGYKPEAGRDGAYGVAEVSSYEHFDGIQTAEVLLPAERDRIAALKGAYAAAVAEANRLNAERAAQKLAEAREYAVTSAGSFLEREAEWLHLPEVAAVKALVEANDVDALYAGGTYDKRPQEVADKAIRAAKAQAAYDLKAAWIRAHGSAHAQRLLAEMGTIDDSMYANERLAVERPGWKYSGHNYSSDVGTPKPDELDRLAAARLVDPGASLKRIRVAVGEVLRPFSTFLGQSIYYTLGSKAEASPDAGA